MTPRTFALPSAPLHRRRGLAPAVAACALLAACSASPAPGAEGSPSPTAPAPTASAPAATPPATTAPEPTAAAPTAEPTPPSTPQAPVARATVVVTYASWDASQGAVAVGSYVEGVVESGGTCTLRLTGPGADVVVSAAAVADAGSTSCGELVARPTPAGTWSATVEYASPATRGTSAASAVVVP